MVKDKEFWEKLGSEIVDEILDSIEYWCWKVTTDPVEDCYVVLSENSLIELAELFTDVDLKLLKEMPKEIYEKYEAIVKKELQRTAQIIKEGKLI
jgi:hypothetical protein